MAVREAPRIETERLVLRPWRREDRLPYFAILQEPAVHRHFGPEPMGMEELWRRLLASAGSWSLLGFGGWAAERKSDGALVGTVTLFNGWRGLDPEFGEEPEMGWIFASEVHGQGFAGEACTAALGWAESNLLPTPVWAIIAPANEPSIKLARKLGFEPLHETAFHEDRVLVLKRPAWA